MKVIKISLRALDIFRQRANCEKKTEIRVWEPILESTINFNIRPYNSLY